MTVLALRRTLRLVAVALAVAFLAPVAASALPITYIYSGVASGSLAGVAFTDVAFTITAEADTDNIGAWCCSDLQNTHSSASVNLASIGSFSFSGATHTWIEENCCMGFGANLGANYLTLSGAGIVSVGYGLNTAIGPVASSASTQNQFVDIATSGGGLTFLEVSRVTFEARMQTEPVPEPATSALLAAGLLALRVRRRTRT